MLDICKHEPELTIVDDASIELSTPMDSTATHREDTNDISKANLQQKKKKCVEPPAQCKICSKMFSRASVLKLHLETHNKDRMYFECDVCAKKIATRHAFISHFRTAHAADKTFQCKSCPKRFATKKSFQKHSRMHTAPYKFKCHVCLMAFKEKSVLKTHMKRHLRQPVTCKLCGRVFETQKWLDFHLRTTNHNKTHSYSCDICGKTFRSRNTIKGHFITHQTEEKVECKTCFRKFKHPKRLQQHMLRLKHTDLSNVTFKCIVCPELFASKNSLDEHFTIHFDGKHFTCNICPKKYSRVTHLKRHSLVKHIKPNTRFKCELCSQTFQHEVTLKTHLNNHMSIPSDVHKCGHCAKTFSKSTDLRVHQIAHKPLLKCEFCHNSFRLQTLLDKHVEIHDEILYKESTGTGDYHCDICSTVVSTKIGIWKHLKSHTQSLQCEFCLKRFDFERKFRSHLTAHIAKAMNTYKHYRCESCPMEFDNKCVLEDHVLKYHKAKLYKSKYCTSQFGNRFRWAKHNEEHESKQRKGCKECSQCIPAALYAKHEQMHAAGKQPYSKYIATFWTCNFCDATLATNDNLRKHLANDHRMEFPIAVWKWRCDVCGDEMTLHGLVKHLRKVHGQEFSTATKKWKCIDCSIDCLTYGGV